MSGWSSTRLATLPDARSRLTVMPLATAPPNSKNPPPVRVNDPAPRTAGRIVARVPERALAALSVRTDAASPPTFRTLEPCIWKAAVTAAAPGARFSATVVG